MDIKSLCEKSAAQAAKSGFVGQTLPEFVALVHSELSEALEEHRDHRSPQDVWYSVHSPAVERAIRDALGLQDDQPLPKGCNPRIPCSKGTQGAKPEGIPSELADVVIRVAHYAGANGIDLSAAIEEKAAYNATRSFRHGGRSL
jgi:hypothetical protein